MTQPFKLNPGLVAIAVDYAGTNAVARGYIADELCPIVRVDSPEFRYPEADIERAFEVVDNQVDRLGRLNEIWQEFDEAVGAVKDYGLSQPVPYRDEAAAMANSLPFDLKARAVRNVVDKNQLAREVRVASLMQNAANYGGQTENENGTPWSGAAFDIGGTVEAAADSMLLPPNVAFMSKSVRRTLRSHGSLASRLGGDFAKGKSLRDDELAEALGVERIIVGNTLKRTTKIGQALATGPIWGDHFGLLHVPATGGDGMVNDVNVPAFALTFQWNDEVSGEVPDPEMGLYGGVRVRSGRSLVEKVVAPFGGYLFQNVLG